MIDIHDGELKDLWPDEKSPEFLSISYAIELQIAHIITLAAKVGVAYDINDLDEEILDYLGIELRAVYYNQSLPIKTKRDLVKNALVWRSKAGTTQAVREMVQTIFGTGDVVEWYEGGYPVDTFRIILDTQATPETMDDLIRIIERVKNVRSHLIALTFKKKIEKNLYIGSALASNRKYENSERPHLSYDTNGSAFYGAGNGVIRFYHEVKSPHLSENTAAPAYIGSALGVVKLEKAGLNQKITAEGSTMCTPVGVVQTSKRITVQ